MPAGWSILLGGLLGLCYVAASVLVTCFARRTPKFVLIVLGGTLIRMTVALALLVMSALLLPVSVPALMMAFLCVFLVGLGVEVLWILRRG